MPPVFHKNWRNHMKRGPSGLNVAKAIPGFLQYKAAEGISQATLVGYEHDLNVWLKYMGDKAVDQVSVQDIRIRDWMAIAINPDFACALLEKTTQIAIGMVDVGLKACGKYIQILRLAGDDMGHQSGT